MIVLEFADRELEDATRSVVREICDAVDVEVRAFLPTLSPTITLSVSTGTEVIPETGTGGASAEPGLVTFMVDHLRPEGAEAIARSQLRTFLFHELHHQVRGWVLRGGAMQESFMHGVVCEGLATAFERDCAGGHPLWGDYPDNVRAWVDECANFPCQRHTSNGCSSIPMGGAGSAIKPEHS